MKRQPDANDIYYVADIKTENTGQRNERAEFRSNVSSADTHRDVDMKVNCVEEMIRRGIIQTQDKRGKKREAHGGK